MSRNRFKTTLSRIVMCCFCLTGILLNLCACDTLDNRLSKDDIFNLVKENENLISDDIKNNNFDATKELDGIGEINLYDDIIEFSCGGAGFGPATAYCGFYYTEDDNMTAIWCAPESEADLEPYENGFLYEQENGDNRYYTEKICDNFYYYEASY